MELADAAFRERLQHDIVELEPLKDMSGALLVARQAVQRLGGERGDISNRIRP